jgi:hypothetical protein
MVDESGSMHLEEYTGDESMTSEKRTYNLLNACELLSHRQDMNMIHQDRLDASAMMLWCAVCCSVASNTGAP